MAEIHQPVPIKPIWPTRRDGHPKRHKSSQDANDRKRRDSSGKEVREESQRSHIDDYA